MIRGVRWAFVDITCPLPAQAVSSNPWNATSLVLEIETFC